MNEVGGCTRIVFNPAPPVVSAVVSNSHISQANISVLQNGGLLEIVATVDAEELKTLKEILAHYENILALQHKQKAQ